MDAIRERLSPGTLRRVWERGSAEADAQPQELTETDETRTTEQAQEDPVAAEGAAATESAVGGDVRPPGSVESACGVALVAGIIILIVLGTTAVWLGYQALQGQRVNAERDNYVQVARQAAVNLTTIDYAHADADVQQIIDGSTGDFRDGFSARAQPFVDTVKRAQSRSVGTVTQAGLESMADGRAQAIVSVTVSTATAAGDEDGPKSWRMRLGLEATDDGVKVSHVDFVQ